MICAERSGRSFTGTAAEAYGFLRPHGGGVNVFTHIKDVDGNVEPELGAVVRYELGTGLTVAPALPASVFSKAKN